MSCASYYTPRGPCEAGTYLVAGNSPRRQLHMALSCSSLHTPNIRIPLTMSHREPPKTLKVLTLNVWGLNYLSKLRQFRISHIADRIYSGSWDVVALQEIWCEQEDWQYLKAKVEHRLPYSKFFLSGAFGSGLAILSRFPIYSSHTQPYSLNGLPIHVGHGDWFVGKGAGCASIDLGDGLLVDVWDTHTVAAGGEDGPEKMRAHRICQAWELSKMIQSSADKGRHVIALGDFNSTPPSLSIALLRHLGQLTDAFLATHPSLPAHATSLPNSTQTSADPDRAIQELGVTCDSPLNTWTAGKKLDPRALAGAGKRLDYIFYRGPAIKSTSPVSFFPPDQGRLRATSCHVCFTERISGTDISYTDHFGLEATFDILPADHEEQVSSSQTRYKHDLAQTLASSMSALGAYANHSKKTQRTHLMGFCACVTLALGLAVSTPFVGYSGYSFWAAIAIVLATAAGWGGTTLLYSGLVWGEWEKRESITIAAGP